MSRMPTVVPEHDNLIASINGVRKSKDKFDLEDAYYASQYGIIQQTIAKKVNSNNYIYKQLVNSVTKDATYLMIRTFNVCNSASDGYEEEISISTKSYDNICHVLEKSVPAVLMFYCEDLFLGYARAISIAHSLYTGDRNSVGKNSERPHSCRIKIYWINKKASSPDDHRLKVLNEYKDYLGNKKDGEKIQWHVASKCCEALDPDHNLDIADAAAKLNIAPSNNDDTNNSKRDKRKLEKLKISTQRNKFDYNILIYGSYQEYADYVAMIRANQWNGDASMTNFSAPLACNISPETLKLYIDDLSHRIKHRK